MTQPRGSSSATGTDPSRFTRAALVRHEDRRSLGDRPLGTGSLACDHCDAPIAPHPGRLALTEPLSCPFCGRRSPLRDFLSLAEFPRPARVIVRLSGAGPTA